MKTFAPNNGRFKILTDDGFSDFVGVTKTKSENKHGHKIIKLYYDSDFYIKTTPDHKIFFEEFSAKESYKFKIGDSVLTNDGIRYITKIEYDYSENVYDILHVENNNRFYCSNKSNEDRFETDNLSPGKRKLLIFLKNCIMWEEAGVTQNAELFYESVYPTISSSDKTKVIITSTPKGMNFFYKMWVESEEGRSEYVAYKVLWQEHPDRDQNWYDTMKANLNAKSLEQEVNCVAGDTLVNINGNNVTIESLYNKFNKTNNSSNSVVYFNDIKIGT